MSLDVRQVLDLVVRPALRSLGERYATPAAERLVLGTGAVESGLRFLRQQGNGPALGLWQMEPATFRDHLRRGGLVDRHDLRPAILGLSFTRARHITGQDYRDDQPTPNELVANLALAAAMCRVHYLRDQHPLPEPDDINAQAATWKRCYNTAAGAGTPAHYLRAYERLVAPIFR